MSRASSLQQFRQTTQSHFTLITGKAIFLLSNIYKWFHTRTCFCHLNTFSWLNGYFLVKCCEQTRILIENHVEIHIFNRFYGSQILPIKSKIETLFCIISKSDPPSPPHPIASLVFCLQDISMWYWNMYLSSPAAPNSVNLQWPLRAFALLFYYCWIHTDPPIHEEHTWVIVSWL